MNQRNATALFPLMLQNSTAFWTLSKYAVNKKLLNRKIIPRGRVQSPFHNRATLFISRQTVEIQEINLSINYHSEQHKAAQEMIKKQLANEKKRTNTKTQALEPRM